MSIKFVVIKPIDTGTYLISRLIININLIVNTFETRSCGYLHFRQFSYLFFLFFETRMVGLVGSCGTSAIVISRVKINSIVSKDLPECLSGIFGLNLGSSVKLVQVCSSRPINRSCRVWIRFATPGAPGVLNISRSAGSAIALKHLTTRFPRFRSELLGLANPERCNS